MNTKSQALLLVLISVIFVNSGQLLLKHGLNQIAPIDFQQNIVTLFLTVFFNPFVFLGVILFVSSSFFWLLALSRAHLSLAFPILSIGYVFVALMSWILFNEIISVLRFAGLSLIVLGVVLMSRT